MSKLTKSLLSTLGDAWNGWIKGNQGTSTDDQITADFARFIATIIESHNMGVIESATFQDELFRAVTTARVNIRNRRNNQQRKESNEQQE